MTKDNNTPVYGMFSHGEIIRCALRDEMNVAMPRFQTKYDMRTSRGRDLSRAVGTYRKFHAIELRKMVEKTRARKKRNMQTRLAQSIWESNVLNNPLYLDYKRTLTQGGFGHLRVRSNMLTVDRRNHYATNDFERRILAILKSRKVDLVEGTWY